MSFWCHRRRLAAQAASWRAESCNCADAHGSTNQGGQISSAILRLAPGVHTSSFDFSGSQRGVSRSTTVRLGSLYDQTFSLARGIVNQTITVGTTPMRAFSLRAVHQAILEQV